MINNWKGIMRAVKTLAKAQREVGMASASFSVVVVEPLKRPILWV